MSEIRKFPDIQSYIRFLRGKSNEIEPIEAEKPKKKKKKATKKAEKEVKDGAVQAD